MSRSTRELLQVRESSMERLGITMDTSVQRHRKLGREIFEARRHIRSLNLLGRKSCGLFSFDAQPVELDNVSLTYLQTSAENQLKYIKNYLKDTKTQLSTITIAQKDLVIQDVTLKSARDMIAKKIGSLRGGSFNFFNKQLKNCKTKEDLLSLHGAVTYTVEMESETNIDFSDLSENLGSDDE